MAEETTPPPVVATLEIAGAWIGPAGLHLRAKQYLEAAETLPRGPGYNPVPYFLCCRAIELALKAFLRLKGEKLDRLKRRIGHHLLRALARARRHSLDQVYSVTPAQVGELAKAHRYYNEKSFEYFDVYGLFHGYKDLPDLDVLRSLARELVTTLEQPCYEAIQSPPPP
jgi:HEPN domain-containing protein